jgi:hypothetical protein
MICFVGLTLVPGMENDSDDCASVRCMLCCGDVLMLFGLLEYIYRVVFQVP